MAEIKELSIKHKAIMDYMLQNPMASGRAVADHFGVTQAWLSTIIHSNAFQSELAKRRAEIEIQIAQDIPTRMRGLTHMALANLEAAYDLGTATRAMDMDVIKLGLDVEGYTGKSSSAPAPSVNFNINIDAGVLASAREKMINLAPTPTEHGSIPALTLEPSESE